MAGLTPEGFTPKRYNEILTDIQDELKPSFGSGVDTSTESVLGLLLAPICLEITEPWDGTELIYNSQNPNTAEGVALDNIGAITNTNRREGTFSVVNVNVSGDEGAIIPALFRRSVETTGEIFETKSSYTLPATGEQPLLIQMTALNDGAVEARAGTLNQGSLPSGVTEMINPTDAELGTLDETNEEYRISRKENLAKQGGGTMIAIKAALLDTDGVTTVKDFENDTNETIGDLPPHSARFLVEGGTDQDIIDTLGIKKGAGTTLIGAVTGFYTDPTDGKQYLMKFDRATALAIYVIVNILTKDSSFPADGAEQIENKILELSWDVGQDVTLPRLQSAVTSIPGILTYELFFGTSPNPTTDTNITVGDIKKADFDSARIDVNVS